MAIAPAESIDECFATDSHTMFANLPPNQPELDIAVVRDFAHERVSRSIEMVADFTICAIYPDSASCGQEL
jgi:hypothetical protein